MEMLLPPDRVTESAVAFSKDVEPLGGDAVFLFFRSAILHSKKTQRLFICQPHYNLGVEVAQNTPPLLNVFLFFGLPHLASVTCRQKVELIDLLGPKWHIG